MRERGRRKANFIPRDPKENDMKKLLFVVALLAGCAMTGTEQAPVQAPRAGPGPTQE